MSDICGERCNISFAEQHQRILTNLCILQGVSAFFPGEQDQFVKVSSLDPTSAFLSDKLVGVSGITFTEEGGGVSGNTYVASVDLDYIADNLAISAVDQLNFEINAGIHNGHVKYKCLDLGVESLTYPGEVNPCTSWNIKVFNDIGTKDASIVFRWAVAESVSGNVLFGVEYNSVGVGESVGFTESEIVSGISDGTLLKMYESTLSVSGGFIEQNDQFLLKLSRLGSLPEDDLAAPIQILGVSLEIN